MHYLSFASTLAILTPLTQAWLIEFWGTQSNCAKLGGEGGTAADTERGGLSCQSNKCMMLGLENTRSIKISDWDDNCRVALWNLTGNCEGEPIWTSTKQEMAANGRLVSNNWSCQTGIDRVGGGPVYFAGYICE